MRNYLSTMIGIFSLALAVLAVSADTSNALSSTIRLISISAAEDSAVVRDSDGKTTVVRPGDSLGAGSKITKISEEGVVLEETYGTATEVIRLYLVGGKQRIEKVNKAKGQMQTQPASTTVERK